MGHHARRESLSGPYPTTARGLDHHELENDLSWPFGKLDGIDRDDVRETAYEIFFTSCRSSPGFGGRNALTFYSSSTSNNSIHVHNNNNGDCSGCGSPKAYGHAMTPTSRVKRALGLKMLRRSLSRRMMSSGGVVGSNPSSPSGMYSGTPAMTFNTLALPPRTRRHMTSAEIMRQQMRVTEHSDNRLRKTLMRTLVGQLGRRAETIILPLELLRHLKSSEFNDTHEYHLWQKRQLKILQVGLLLHPSIPVDKSNTFVIGLSEIIRASEIKPIDTSKNSEKMRTLCNSVVSLSWRSHSGNTLTDVCHWADGYPFNIHLYVALLQSIFDIRDETLVLDEVDELLELMKKTWSTLGITRHVHNVCFTWILFQQYVATCMIEPDLLCAAHAMLTEVATDSKKPNREVIYYKILSTILNSMLGWAEKRLLNYHEYFLRGTVNQIENLLPLTLSTSKILNESVTIVDGSESQKGDTIVVIDSSNDRVDNYVRSSIKNAFVKIVESNTFKEAKEDATELLLQLAKETENLALKEREIFSPILKRWHATATSVACVTLHNCYGDVLRQYLGGVATLSSELVGVLQRAGKLEKMLVQMVVEDSVDCEDGGKSIVREMVPYEVDFIIFNLLKKWMDERLTKGREIVDRAKETETWNPKSKSEPYAQSVVELIKQSKEVVDDFFYIPIGITEDLVQDLADGLEVLFQDYITFVSSAGSKQSYIPTLPPLTRCNRDSKFVKLWKKASHCGVSLEELHQNGISQVHHPRPSTSRGTQRLYIRLNTLHYLLSKLQSLDKTLSLSPRNVPAPHNCFNNSRRAHSTFGGYFEHANSCIQVACQHVSEVAAYRLIFLDSNSAFYDSLYWGDVANARIRHALIILKQNLTLMSAILTDEARGLAIKEVMIASFEAFLMVLLAGGSSRVFYRIDYEMIEEDFESLKKVFRRGAEGLISEDLVEREAETVEGVIALMGESTEQLMEDFSIVTCETSGIGFVGSGQMLPMPPTTGRWNRSDPNTLLRVLCHRNDRVANQFLKRSFQLAKRR